MQGRARVSGMAAAVPGALALVVMISSALTAIWAVPFFVEMGDAGGSSQQPAAPSRLVTAVRVGLEPKALAAIGVTADALPALIGRLDNALAEHGAALAQADQRVDSLTTAVGAGVATDGAEWQLSTATADQNRVFAQLRENVLAGLSAEQRALLEAIERNRPFGAPTEYLVVDRTPAEWARLKDALYAEGLKARGGRVPEPPPDKAASVVNSAPIVAAANADARVIQAARNLQNVDGLARALVEVLGEQPTPNP